MASEYEFNEEENKAIGGLSHKMKFVSIFLIIVAILSIIEAIIPIANGKAELAVLGPDIIGALVALLIGVWGINAARSFQKVVDTEGNDIAHLMAAVGNLNKLVGIAYWLLMILIFVFLIGLIAGIVALSMAPV